MNNVPLIANEPPPIERVVIYAPDLPGGFLELPPDQVAGVNYEPNTGSFQVVQLCADGHLERWINVAARVIHKVPGRIVTVPPGARV